MPTPWLSWPLRLASTRCTATSFASAAWLPVPAIIASAKRVSASAVMFMASPPLISLRQNNRLPSPLPGGNLGRLSREEKTMRIIALEEHMSTVMANEAVPPHLRRAAVLVERSKYLGHDMPAELLDLENSRLKFMDENGVDMQLMSLVAPGPQG